MIEECNCDQVLYLKEKLRIVQRLIGRESLISAANDEFAASGDESCCNGEVTHEIVMELDMVDDLRMLGECAVMGNVSNTDISTFQLAYRHSLNARIEDYIDGILFEVEHD